MCINLLLYHGHAFSGRRFAAGLLGLGFMSLGYYLESRCSNNMLYSVVGNGGFQVKIIMNYPLDLT